MPVTVFKAIFTRCGVLALYDFHKKNGLFSPVSGVIKFFWIKKLGLSKRGFPFEAWEFLVLSESTKQFIRPGQICFVSILQFFLLTLIFHCTLRITPKSVTSLWRPSSRHSAMATQLLMQMLKRWRTVCDTV